MQCLSESAQEKPEVIIGKQSEVANKKKMIAVVEDDARLTNLFCEILECAGSWRLHVFSDGQEARDCLPYLGADLILLDVGLPGLDGASLFKILRGHSNTKHTPIILITGSYDWELHRMGLQTGLFLRKPFKMDELLCMISALLSPELSQKNEVKELFKATIS